MLTRLQHSSETIGIDVKENLLLSSSEDKTCRLWDLRINKQTKLFKNQQDDTGFCKFIGANEIVLAAGNVLFFYDLRSPRIIEKNEIEKITLPDEINDFHVQITGERVLCPLDNGEVCLVDRKEGGRSEVVGRHKDIVSFSRFSENVVFSGGYDCSYHIGDKQLTAPQSGQTSGMSINPPFVTCGEVTKDGMHVIGIGDGSILGFENGRKLRTRFHAELLHSSAVVGLDFATHSTRDAARIWSVGVDETLKLTKFPDASQIVNLKLPGKPNYVRTVAANVVAVSGIQNSIDIFTF